MENPFSLIFGVEPKSLISNTNQFEEVKKKLLSGPSMAYVISGARGAGKTVLLTRLAKSLASLDDWVVIELNPSTDMLEYLASSLYEQSKAKFRFLKKEFSFSFNGLSFSISGETPVSNVVTLIEKMMDIIAGKGKKVLLCIDDVYSSQSMRIFSQQYQILIRKGYPLYLLMSGLFENVRQLKDEKGLTFLYRTQQISVGPLSLADIAASLEKTLGAPREEAVKMAKLTKGYAFAYQVLGYLCFEKGKKALDEEIIAEFDSYLRDYVYEKAYFDLPEAEKEIVDILAEHPDASVSEIKERVSFAASGVSQYRDRLIKRGILFSPAWGKLDFALPRFKEYVLLVKEFA